MRFNGILTLIWSLETVVTATLVPLNSNLQFRNALSDTSAAGIHKRDTVFKNSTKFDKSWNGATLFSMYVFPSTHSRIVKADFYSHSDVEKDNGNTALTAGVEVVCTTCYIKGTATAQLTVNGNFNLSQAFQNFKSEVKGDVDSLTNATIDSFETYFEKIGEDVASFDFHLDDLEFPTLNDTSFDLTIPDIPECQLLFEFDGLELYMEIDTTLSAGATYTFNLYTSESLIGVSAGQDLEVGIVFTVDVILSVEAEIDISSGFHIQLNDGVAINIAMFSQNISSVTL
jgi:hypothetical protein